MAGLLADVFSFGDTLKRKARGLLDDPMGTISQFVNNENDRARAFNQLTSQSTDEMISGQPMGPASQKLAGLLADAYNPAGMVVWHGSPHKFTKFDSSKIGTGEGAQAYGHGLYVAESPEVAGQYAANITGPKADPKSVAIKAINSGASDDFAYKLVRQVFKDVPEKDALEAVSAAKSHTGSLYKIDLPDEHIAKMLDWDKPLSQQPKEVQRALNEFGDLVGDKDWSHAIKTDDTGSWFYRMMEDVNKNSPRGSAVDSAKFLRESGVPGIRYLDGGSRGTGQGTSNFVVFPGNEHLLNILERNGQPIGLLGQ